MRFVLTLAIALLSGLPALAQDATRPLTRIAFGSCATQARPQPIWEAVLAYRPELFVFAGDNVYGDYRGDKPVENEAELVDSLRQAYFDALRIPGFAAVKAGVRHLAVWDDHDYGKNDAGAEFWGKGQSQQMFLDFWNVPNEDPRRKREGVYHAETVGPEGKRVQVILLDTRFFRSALKPTDQRGAPGRERYLPDDDPQKTMLGEAQWAWLADRLREPAEVRLVVSSIQLVTDGHGWERWGNLPRERQRFYDLVRDTKANGVVVLSGDRHIAGLYRESAGPPYPITEITSSALNLPFPANREAGPNRLGAVWGMENFGTLDIDWWEGTVALAIRGLNGEPVRRTSLRIEDLRGPN